MVNVSERFRTLATDNGRHVFCRIEAGDEVFYDDRLLEFAFDDVTHPDWFTIGTACANRFHFRALFGGEIAVHEEIRPCISFDGEEWCPLGVFYVSRRYVRGGEVSITAYDRMYDLDYAYAYTGSLPVTSDILLSGICRSEGIPLPDSGLAVEVEHIPDTATVRDMIGYIAALNGACAKIDRYGSLVLKKPDFNGITEHISHKNCFEIQRNMTRSVITCLKAQTETELLVTGEGAEISTLEMYDPLMTQDRLDQLYSLLRPFGFYGADVEMQGLPYLESGEGILLLDGDMAYPIVISEIEYRYDGGLTAVLYSRNKTYIDAAVHEDDLEQALEELRRQLSAQAYRFINDSQTAITATPVTVAEFTFDACEGGFLQLHLNISLSQDTADFVAFRVYVNGDEADRSIVHVPEDVSRTLIQVTHLEPHLTEGSCHIAVTAQTGSGGAYILPKALHASLVAHGGSLGSTGGRDRLIYSDVIPALKLTPLDIGIRSFSEQLTYE